MILDVEKTRSNNKMLVSGNQNYNEMTAGNTSECVPYQCNITIAIKR